MTLIEKARRGEITSEMRQVAKEEEVALDFLLENIACGKLIIPKNRQRRIKKICGIGLGLSVKVNANLGTSPYGGNIKSELKKVEVAEKAGTDTIMDLSCGGNISLIRRAILRKSKVPVGTVPVYETIVEGLKRYKDISRIDKELFFEIVERQAEDGVDFMTIHAGLTREALRQLKQQGRITGIVSRGGSFLAEWMLGREEENPFYTEFDRLLEITRKYDVGLSLGDGLRPGSVADATDRAQIQELLTLGELAQRSLKAGVQVMIEGPGHVPLHQIEANIRLEKELCRGAPFYVLGPLVTDIAPGYDHITAAIGGAMAAFYGADFLCFVTPSEHLRLPTVQDIKEGVMATRLAGHAADLARGLKRAWKMDIEMSKYRQERNWSGQLTRAIDPQRMKELRAGQKAGLDICTMCGSYCSMKRMEKLLPRS